MLAKKTLNIRPRLNKPQAEFLSMPHKFRAYVGGFGCLRGDTLVATEYGLMPIAKINKPMRVLSWNEKKHQFELALTGGAFPKGEGYLYRVVTQQGEFVASEHHHVLDAHNNYRRVDTLCVGDKVQSFSANLHQTSLELAPLSLHAGDERLTQTLASLMGRYADAARQYGQRLHQAKGSDLTSSQQQGDAHTFGQTCERKSGHQGLSPRHSHQGQQSDLLCKMGLTHPHEHHEAGGQGHTYAACFEHTCRYNLDAQQLHQMEEALALLSQLSDFLKCSLYAAAFYAVSALYRIAQYSDKQKSDCSQSFWQAEKQLNQGVHYQQLNALSQSFTYSTIKTSNIVSITQLEQKEVYYDLQVLDNNNYVTADGAIHHNSGKTFSGCAALCKHFYEHPLVNAGYFAPTYPQIRDIFYPTMQEVAEDWGFDVEIRQANKEVLFYLNGEYRGTVICRSMDNPAKIVGFKIGHALVDELDTLPTDKARDVWRKIIARMRYNVPGLKNGIDVTTTPEGFKFTYEQFVKARNSSDDLKQLYGLIQASTYDNELNLPDDYIESLRQSYPQQLIDAYLNGQFVNLASGAVYPEFDRVLNHSSAILKDGEPLHIGMDFNVLQMAAVVFVVRDGKPVIVDELVGVRDTPAMAELIKERYKGHKVVIYPDAAGQATSSKNSSESDHTILRQHGFSVYVNGSNPRIKDRVNAVNALILNDKGERKLLVNTGKCPNVTEALEQQIYDKFGKPDKSANIEHCLDALGYFISHKYPIKKPTTKLQVNWI